MVLIHSASPIGCISLYRVRPPLELAQLLAESRHTPHRQYEGVRTAWGLS
jgi:hypothetical protein